MSVPPFVPHHRFLSWPSAAAARSRTHAGGARQALVRELSRAGVCEQQSSSQRLLSKHLGLWAPISGAVIAALMVACSPHCVGSDAQLA